MPRLFSGIELPEHIKDQLSDLEQPLPGAKWVAPDDLHITLRFFGDVSRRMGDELAELLSDIEIDAFELRLDTIGTFGGHDPRVIWAGVSASPSLEMLARANERAAQSAGLVAESRTFKAHVTLARLRGTPPDLVAGALGKIGAFRTSPFPVSKFVLFTSKPKVGGGPYLVDAEFPLRGNYADATEEDFAELWGDHASR